MIWHFVNILISFLSITYTYWTLADVWVKKDEHLGQQICHFRSVYHFDFLNIRPFSPTGFFTFLVAVAHGAPPPSAAAGLRRH